MVFAKQTRRRIYIRAKSFNVSQLRASLLTILARRLAGAADGGISHRSAADGGISHRSTAAGGISRSRRTAESATEPRRLAEFRVCGGRRNQPQIRGGRRNQPQNRGGWRNFACAADGGISHRSAAAGGNHFCARDAPTCKTSFCRDAGCQPHPFCRQNIVPLYKL